MKPRKIARLRAMINEPSYPLRRLETLQDQFAAFAWSWAIGKDVEVTGKGMERASRKIDRMREWIDEMMKEEERERIHKRYSHEVGNSRQEKCK